MRLVEYDATPFEACTVIVNQIKTFIPSFMSRTFSALTERVDPLGISMVPTS